nr:uncharacterized protein LOC105464167 isoform X1 [Macaca nemestrina]
MLTTRPRPAGGHLEWVPTPAGPVSALRVRGAEPERLRVLCELPALRASETAGPARTPVNSRKSPEEHRRRGTSSDLFTPVSQLLAQREHSIHTNGLKASMDLGTRVMVIWQTASPPWAVAVKTLLSLSSPALFRIEQRWFNAYSGSTEKQGTKFHHYEKGAPVSQVKKGQGPSWSAGVRQVCVGEHARRARAAGDGAGTFGWGSEALFCLGTVWAKAGAMQERFT